MSFRVLISNQNQQSDYVDLYLERLGIPFVVYCEKPESSLVIKNNLKNCIYIPLTAVFLMIIQRKRLMTV